MSRASAKHVGGRARARASELRYAIIRAKVRVSELRRAMVFARQRAICVICDGPMGGRYDVDHIVPRHKGGTNAIDNLQALHPGCHLDKTEVEMRVLQSIAREKRTGVSRYFDPESAVRVAADVSDTTVPTGGVRRFLSRRFPWWRRYLARCKVFAAVRHLYSAG